MVFFYCPDGFPTVEPTLVPPAGKSLIYLKGLLMSQNSILYFPIQNATNTFSIFIVAYLPYLNLNDTGVESSFLPQLDDGISEQIDILEGLPFGNGHPIAVWVNIYCI